MVLVQFTSRAPAAVPALSRHRYSFRIAQPVATAIHGLANVYLVARMGAATTGDLVADFRGEFAQTFIRTVDRTSGDEVRGILDRWAADKTLKAGTDEAKVAALYRTFLDEATGVYNARGFERIGEHHLHLSARTREPVAVVFVRSAVTIAVAQPGSICACATYGTM